MINFMEMTTGQLYFYGGIAGAGISFLCMFFTIVISETKKKKMLRNMESET